VVGKQSQKCRYFEAVLSVIEKSEEKHSFPGLKEENVATDKLHAPQRKYFER